MKSEPLKIRSDVLETAVWSREIVQLQWTICVVINCDYQSESGVRSFTRSTEYGWRGAKREYVHSITVYMCCQEDTSP